VPRKNPALRKRARLIDRRLGLSLEYARASFSHKGNKGSVAEQALRLALAEYLPSRLQIGHGEIIDGRGRSTGQIDVVIAEEDHPKLLAPDGIGAFLLDGVVAVGEVKAVLTLTNLRDTVKRAKTFRSLIPEALEGDIAFEGPPEQRRYWRHRPYFLFAFESGAQLKSIHDVLSKGSKQRGESIDGVFVLKKGWVVDGPKEDASSVYQPNMPTQWVQSSSSTVAFDFLAWLSVAMPKQFHQVSVLSAYWAL